MTAVLNPALQRDKDESFTDYHIRLFKNKDTYNIDTKTIAELLNKEHGSHYDESKWRKDYKQYERWYAYIMSKNIDKDIQDKYQELFIESEKAKVRKRDQNREFAKKIRNQARFEKIKDDVAEAILNLESKRPLNFTSPSPVASEKHGLALFSDWHFGMEIENRINKFNKAIFNDRVEHLTKKVIEYGKLNHISTLHIANLGDLIGGLIHVSTRVQANEDAVEQIKYVSETLAEVLAKFASEFQEIRFYNVAGNHGRLSPSKNDVGIKENFEYLINWYLEARLRDIENISIEPEQDGFIPAKINNSEVVFVHGHYDRVDQCVTRLPQLLGYIPSYIFGGHIHHNYEKEYGSTTVVVNGALVGADDYAMQGRFGTRPSQKFLVFDDEGIEATYIIRFKS
ncbi:metallophosphoesterase [Bacillus haynesii]|uniref:metallophosphoesterase family protein n=1 Tax=Bacillus haynesii TaxID=1925021 RepID=UPI0022823E07|nr:metallophosphoesterase family protein [Bacillus haynesii]MCY9226050.1 metallophosphoesterase [Bacillus haynesii]MCY9290958.1 metallophosphoesterase [Bacillus haynesii]